MSQKLFTKTLIIGLGLIGGSFAKALRQQKISSKICALDLDLEAIDLAKNDGVIDGGADNFALIDDNFDLIVIAAPLSAYEEIFAEIADNISLKTLVIDLGSVKNFIGEILPKNLAQNFIACHPIAGLEKTGFENADASIFQGKKFVICPNQKNHQNDVQKITKLAEEIGFTVDLIDAKKHDEIYALVSHLPQFLSFLTKEFSPKNISDNFFKTAFRLDDSDPEIWAEIFELNEENLEEFYLEFFDNLEKNIAQLKNENHLSKTAEFDEKFFEQNFAAIFFRALVAKSYLEISAIKSLQSFAGTGFKDFTSITEIFAHTSPSLLSQNHKQIQKLFQQLN